MNPDNRIVTLYKPIGNLIYDDVMAYLSPEAVSFAIRLTPAIYREDYVILPITWRLPANTIWQDTPVLIDLYRSHDHTRLPAKVQDGIWFCDVPGFAHVDVINLKRNEVFGHIRNSDNRYLQAVLLQEGFSHFPYRHLRSATAA